MWKGEYEKNLKSVSVLIMSMSVYVCVSKYEGVSGRAVGRKPRSREPRVISHTICLGSPGKCSFFIPDNSWGETSSGPFMFQKPVLIESFTDQVKCLRGIRRYRT